MTPSDVTVLINGHAEMLARMDTLLRVFEVLAFLGIMFVLAIFGAAAWSVNRVVARLTTLEHRYDAIVTLLIDYAKHDARQHRKTEQLIGKH